MPQAKVKVKQSAPQIIDLNTNAPLMVGW